MIKRLFPLIVMAAGLFASCASDDAANGGTESTNTYDGVVAEVLPMEDASQGTRSSLSFHPQNGMIFAWNAPTPNPDVLTVFPASGAASGNYTLSNILNENKTVAQFTATGFSLSKNMRYYALSKKEDTGKHPNWKFPSAGNITVDYSGQRQTASGDDQTSHLGEYDFMAATALCEAQDQAYFAFKHLGLTLRMILKGLPAGVEYTELEIYDSENTFRQPIRTINLANGLDGEGNYTPAYNELDVNSDSYKQADRFKLALGSGEGEHPGIITTDEDGVTSGKKKIVAYIELPPFDFTGKDIVFFLKSKDGTKNYYGTYEGYKLNAGKAYQMTVNMKPATTYIVNVKVAYNWQLGNAQPALAKTRATGDPGFDDSFEAPNYIYAFFCVNGKVKDYSIIHVGEKISTNPNDAWTAPDQNNVITYKTPLTFSVDNPTDANSARVYIAASKTALTLPSITKATSAESVVNTMTYSIPGVVAAPSSNVALDASQQFLRDLYSTPWEGSEHAATFEGALKDYYHDIVLYHVAAKVDLKWNSTSVLSGNVSVNSVVGTGLSIFQPTTNTWDTGSYTVTTPITDGTKWNGRQVYYLPQFANSNCKYNVTIGSKTQYVTFSPATTSGYTSWLRWVKDY